MTGNVLIDGPVTQEIISTMLNMTCEEKMSGAHSVFLGRVRADVKGSRTVRAIEYTAYGEMVSKAAAEIFKQVLSEYGDVKTIDILHSTGRVMAGEVSLLVIVSGGHRKQAMEACSKIVDLIKERFPVWKKEIFADDTHEWVNGNLA